MQKFKKKDTQKPVIAVQLNLETDGLDYNKWGDKQHAKAGDWILNNGGECYTIDKESFEKTYQEVSTGQYKKVAPVWATKAYTAGHVNTKQGKTAFKAGDMLVVNNEDGTDAYAMSKEKFDSMYVPV